MPYLPLALVVVAALAHATWNLLAKRAADVGVAFVFAYNLICCVMYAPWALYVFAKGALHPSALIAAFFLLSGGLHLAYSLSLQRGYRLAPLSVVYPVARGSGPLLSSLAAITFFHEAGTPLRLVGLGGVIVGILLISTEGKFSRFVSGDGVLGVKWGLATGGLIAGYTVADAYAVRSLGVEPVLLDWVSNSLRFVVLAPVVFRPGATLFRAMRGQWPLAIGVGVLSPLGYILVLSALRMGAPVTVVAPMREMSMMIGALLGMIVLREPVGPARLIGCAILIGGVLMLGA